MNRHHFALARLIAHFVEDRQSCLSGTILLANDRDQSAIENYSVAIWFYVTTVCYIAAAVPWLLAIPLAVVAISLPLLSGAGMKANGQILMLLQFSASAYFATASGPVKYVAWLFLIVFFMNSAAWILARWLEI